MSGLDFDAVAETRAGAKWRARWDGSWPAYRPWFLAGGGATGPGRDEAAAALARHMPELVPVWRRLAQLAGGGELEARFLAGWCPPRYLGGCSVAAAGEGDAVRLVRNYDLAPELNEGLLFRSEWTGRPVMGMVEFLWGLSDGVNGAGLAAAIAYGGRREVREGFGVTTILRYVLETCATVEAALAVLRRVPSHMAYNLVLADRGGAAATAELKAGGGVAVVRPAVATNHQRGVAAGADPTESRLRRAHLERLLTRGLAGEALEATFLEAPLYRTGHAAGFGTLFTAVYDPGRGGLALRWPGERWDQSLAGFVEGRREIRYGAAPAWDVAGAFAALGMWLPRAGAAALDAWCREAEKGAPDWARLGAARLRPPAHRPRDRCRCGSPKRRSPPPAHR